MVANISFNPLATTNGIGSFNVESAGYIQGQAMDDPSARYRLAGGILAPTETLVMWGGVAISQTTTPVSTATSAPRSNLGGYISRATSIPGIANGAMTGFSVFDQNYSAITSPQSPVPLAGSGGQVNYYRFGSNARIAVAIDPSLVSLEGNIISQQVSWDFVGQRLIPYSVGYAQTTITGAVWSNTSGGQISFTVGTDLTADLNAGDDINVANVINTGGASTGAFNGAWTVVSVDSTHVVVSAPAAATIGTYASGGIILAGGGAIPVKILDVNIGNSMTVSYDTVTGFATWNRSGSAALIQI